MVISVRAAVVLGPSLVVLAVLLHAAGVGRPARLQQLIRHESELPYKAKQRNGGGNESESEGQPENTAALLHGLERLRLTVAASVQEAGLPEGEGGADLRRANMAELARKAANLHGDSMPRYIRVMRGLSERHFFVAGSLTSQPIRFGLYAPVLHAIWYRLLTRAGCSSDTLFVDAGANVGYFSQLAASLGCQVASIEANRFQHPYIASAALQNAAASGSQRIDLWPAAVGDFPPGSVMTTTHNVVGSTEVDGAARAVVVSSQMSLHSNRAVVPAVPLDAVLRQYPNASKVWMKMDVEGAELGALRSARELLSSGRLQALAIEVKSPYRRRDESQPQYRWNDSSVPALLGGYGYDCVSWIEGYFLGRLSKAKRQRLLGLLAHDRDLLTHLLPCECLLGLKQKRELIFLEVMEEFLFVKRSKGVSVRQTVADMFGVPLPAELARGPKCQWRCVHGPDGPERWELPLPPTVSMKTRFLAGGGSARSGLQQALTAESKTPGKLLGVISARTYTSVDGKRKASRKVRKQLPADAPQLAKRAAQAAGRPADPDPSSLGETGTAGAAGPPAVRPEIIQMEVP